MAVSAAMQGAFGPDLVARGLPASPAAFRTRQDDNATLLVSWWCTGFALTIIIIRVIGRYVRSEKLFMEDKVMALSIIPLLIRMAFVQVVLRYGTNNTTELSMLSAQAIYQRSIGSRLVLAARIFYALFIWTVKYTVSEFLKRITYSTWSPTLERVLRLVRIFLVVTFFAVVIATLAECQPFDHYWQVVPDPGLECRSGYAQLLVMGICDCVTDLILVLFPIPAVIRSSLPVKRKISVSLLFSLSLILIAITAYRMPAVIAQHGSQQRRSLIASLEILAAAATSNALIIGSFVRDKGVKKGKYHKGGTSRSGSVDQPSINRLMTRQHWGGDSDEDLFRSLGCRLNSVASGMPDGPVPRAPEKVGLAEEQETIDSEKGNGRPRRLANSAPENTGSRTAAARSSGSPNPPRISTANGSANQLSRHFSRGSYQNMTLFDAGGILETDETQDNDDSEYSPTDMRHPSLPNSDTQDFAAPNHQLRRDRSNGWSESESLQSGGASAANEAPRRGSLLSRPGRQSAAPRPDPSGFDLQDPGGLLL